MFKLVVVLVCKKLSILPELTVVVGKNIQD